MNQLSSIPRPRRGRAGLALAETMVAAAVTSVLAAGLLVTSIVVQKNFRACQNHTTAQADQLRLLDSISRDLRGCLTVTTGTNAISMTVPDFYDDSGVPRDPVIRSGGVDYGDPNAPVTISYYKQGDTIYRSEGGTVSAMAEAVDDFEIAFDDQSDVIETSITFLPKFRQWGSSDSVRTSSTAYSSTLLRNTRQN
jgi:hypothetical protein